MNNSSESLKRTFVRNFVGGIATALGLTVGIALISYFLSFMVSSLGGLPLVGNFLANIVNLTIESLGRK